MIVIAQTELCLEIVDYTVYKGNEASCSWLKLSSTR